jgi:hypothetical protein
MSALSLKEQVTRSLDDLSEPEIQQVSEFVAFLKFRARIAPPPAIDADQLALLYAESAEEDRQLAEEGMGDYHALLQAEDRQ